MTRENSFPDVVEMFFPRDVHEEVVSELIERFFIVSHMLFL